MEKINKDGIIELSEDIIPHDNYIVEQPVKCINSTRRNLNINSIQNSHVVKDMIIDNVSKLSIFQDPYPEIDNLDDLLLYLTDVIIHFDTNPNFYIKDDYRILISTITKSLIYLYKNINQILEQDEEFKSKILQLTTLLSELQNRINVDIPEIKQTLDTKVDKEEGKGLSDQNFTQEEKDKLASLHNYDDTALKTALEQEISRSTTNDINLAKNLSDEQYRASGAEEALSKRIDATNQELSTIPSLIATAKSEAIITAAENTSTVANEVLSESKTYTDNKLKSLTGALIYKGKYEVLPEVENFDNGNVIIVGNKEYVLTVDNDSKFWVELGDESAWDQLGAADAALQAAKEYADSLSVNYDSIGSAAQALQDAKDYTDKRIVAQIIRY